ncbi:MAG: C-terminal helicase domain-containing protein, partial [Muribaculaceae bacterium]|nr:C-terminal helicase domain-containing protein [Muribaculaceae bacterium]
NILHDPAEVKIAVSRPAEKIRQSVFICHEAQKLGILKSIFAGGESKRVIVFASSKLNVKELARTLRREHLNVGEMHSDLEQAQRDAVMHEFKAGRVDILVATDIVARGIDIDDIAMVVNYDVPHDYEDYVHRIGRTARANNDGRAVTFVGGREQSKFGMIERMLGMEVMKETVPAELGEAPEYNPNRKSRNGGGRNGGKRRSGGDNGRSKSSRNRSRKDAKSVEKPNGAGAEVQKTASGKKPRRNKRRRNSGSGNASQPTDKA